MTQCTYCQSLEPCYAGFSMDGHPCQHPDNPKQRVKALEQLVFSLGDKLLILAEKMSVLAERKEMRNITLDASRER